VFCGFIDIDADKNIRYFVRRPSQLQGDNIARIRRPEDMAEALADLKQPASVGFELDSASFSSVSRLAKIFPNAQMGNASAVIRRSRAVKTAFEIHLMEISGIKQTEVYRNIPRLYCDGMTDVEFLIEIERALRLAGCLGQFRINGNDMELHMGNVLTGENADTPSPYDFAMGGAGQHPSLPIGANGTMIKPGFPVMVDVNGNFTGYMTDMTRSYAVGRVSDLAADAHKLSCDICAAIADAARAGVEAKAVYQLALMMAEKADMADYFMGHRYHAGFVGHGLGIAINESPVLAPRSRDIFVPGNTIAVEPKFVIPGVGAIGIENTYVITDGSEARKLTNAPEEIVELS
jgi:Xaa-Pro aminopeptidase